MTIELQSLLSVEYIFFIYNWIQGLYAVKLHDILSDFLAILIECKKYFINFMESNNLDTFLKKYLQKIFDETQFENTVETQIKESLEESEENLERMKEYFQFLVKKINSENDEETN